MRPAGELSVVGVPVSVANPWLFFGVTFAVTWSFWALALVLDVSLASVEGALLLLAGLAGPGVAGIGFTYLVYDERGRRDYWRRVTDVRRIGVAWFVVVLLLAPAVNAVAALIDVFLGGAGATWSAGVREFTANPLSLFPAVFFATLPPFVEELGWRGYALDRLQRRRSALGASLILGTAWSLWHLPLFFVRGTYQQGLGVGTPEFWLFVIGIVPLSVAFTWVYNHTSRSVLAVVLLHGTVNFAGELVHLTRTADAAAIVVWVAVAVGITAVWGPSTLTGSDDVPHPPRPGPR